VSRRPPLPADAASLIDEVIAAARQTLEAKVGAYRREHRLPGVMAGIATRDGLRWWWGSGFADLESGRRADERTLYRVASITKTITATMVLQLRDEGRLRLDDPAVRFVPEIERIANPHGPIEALTIRRLLQHTSGLQGEVPWQDTDRFWLYRPEELPGILHLGAVRTPPETEHKYSNFAFELLGMLVERVAGRRYEEHARAAVLDPLGMRDTTWDPDPDQAARKAVGYDGRNHDDVPRRSRDIGPGQFVADGGLWSTAEDLGRWLGQQLRADPSLRRGEGEVLDGKTLAEMHRPTFVTKPDLTEGQGLGWYATRTGEVVLVGHSGALWGYLSNVSFSVSGKVGAIVLLNGVGPAPKLARDLIEALLPALKEAEDRAEVAQPVPSPAAYRELLGEYRDRDDGDDTVIEWRDGKLMLLEQRPGVPHHELLPTDDPLVFTIQGARPGGEAIVFGRGADGRIVRCNAAGYPLIRLDLLAEPTRD
jgi:CubicO group peptidase (beta-lactamase class C family)